MSPYEVEGKGKTLMEVEGKDKAPMEVAFYDDGMRLAQLWKK